MTWLNCALETGGAVLLAVVLVHYVRIWLEEE